MADFPESDFDREFRSLYCKYSAFVRYVLTRFGIPQANVDDVAQEVFLTVLKKLPDFERRSDIKTWIFAICRYKASEERRRPHHRYEQPLLELETPSATSEPPEALERRTDSELLDRALGSLSEVQRQVFVRRVIDGESVAEIASGLGCSAFTVYTRLSVAARKMQSFVEKRWSVAVWLLPFGRAGERSPRAPEAGRVTGVHWPRRLLELLLPVTAATFVMMTPAPNAAPGLRRPARAVAPAAAKASPAESDAPAPIVPSAMPAAIGSPPAPQRPAHVRARSKRIALAGAENPVEQIAEPAPEPPAAEPEPEREQEILWRSRLALDTNPGRALALAEEHAATHREGLLKEEREVLALEALLRLRRPTLALERARIFTATYPDSPYAGPVRQLIERLSFSAREQAVADSRRH